MMLKLTRDDLQHIAPRPKTPKKALIWDGYVDALTSDEGSSLFDQAEINTPRRMQHALAQWSGAETGGLSIIFESGAYSAAGLMRVYGPDKHSSPLSWEEAEHLASLPIFDDGSGPRADAIFERVYGYQTIIGPKMGNVHPGDGAKYRGLGLNQATGYIQWSQGAKKIGCPIDDLHLPINLLKLALFEWTRLGLNKYADRDDLISIRKLINAGRLDVSISRVNGIPEAQAALRLAKNVIASTDVIASISPDVPSDIDHATPNNENQPDSLMQSREAQAAMGHTMIGGGMSADGFYDAVSTSMAAHPQTMSEFMLNFAWALGSNKVFLAGLAVMAGGIFAYSMRRWRYYVHGV